MTDRHCHSNPLDIAPLFRWLVIAALLCACGLLFVRVKNQQHTLGKKTREVETQIAEERSRNEVLLARVSALSSRRELERKFQSGKLGAMHKIPENAVARLTPPAEASPEGLVRTAASERVIQ